MRRIAAALLAFASLPALAQVPLLSDRTDWSAPAAAWWAHVQYLADDKLQGRKTGTPGYAAAVAYVQDQFKAIGLKPGGTDGYQQPIEFQPASTDVTKSGMSVDRNGQNVAFTNGVDVSLSPHVSSSAPVTAPMIFLGYGLHVPRKHDDDLAGLDLKGKVVVLYNAAPQTLQGPQRAYARIADQRWKALRADGAIGILMITPPRAGAPAPSTPRTGPTAPSAQLYADPALESLPGLQVNGTLTAAGMTKLLEGTDHPYAEIKIEADAGGKMPHFDLPGTLHVVTVPVMGQEYTAPNVIGLLEGSDPKLKHEYVIVSAHLDHLGIGREVNGDGIYNGAMDNASGVASVIECAKLLAAQPHPKRSILFIALAGEELGELGSQYFATKPTVPKKDIVADLNMDMYLPLFALRFIEVQGLGESTLGNDARAAFQLNDVEVQFDKQPDENRFVRSDQVNFVKQGIPALAFKFGWTPDSQEMKIFNDWVKTRYHQPSDDLQQPVDKVAAAQFTAVLAQLATRVAVGPRPEWYPESSLAPANK